MGQNHPQQWMVFNGFKLKTPNYQKEWVHFVHTFEFPLAFTRPFQEKNVENGTRLINQGDDGESWKQNFQF